MNKFQVFYFAIVVLAIQCAQANPLFKGPDAVEYDNCKNLCDLCNCIGFYCGDECICECFDKSNGNANCVQEVQNKAENSDTPYEVLVQGPSGNRFVRSLVLADGSEAELEIDPAHVSTFSIYQPKHLVKRDVETEVAEAISGTLNADAAPIDEQIRPTAGAVPVPAATAGTTTTDADKKDAKDGDEKVGLALPVAPLIGLGVLNRGIGIRNSARLLPIGVGIHTLTNPALSPLTNPVLNPVVTPGLLPARLAALRARVAALPIGIGAAALI